MIANEDMYINEAYKQLEIISQNRQMQIAYTSRQKALYDYNTIMTERYEIGREEGREEGRQEGRQEERTKIIEKFIKAGYAKDELYKILGIDN